MSLKREIEQDIDRFFNNIELQLPEEKKKTLMLLMDKYIHLSTTPTVWDGSDLLKIKEAAIILFNDRKWPKKIGKHGTISGSEITQICLVEATIGHLHRNDFLNKTPKFDYKE